MMKTVDADITPSVLVWARQTIGYELEEAAKKIGVEPEVLDEWEQGKSKPSFAKLQTISNVYKRPTATFYLETPPADVRAPKDFRLLNRGEERTFSRGLRLNFRETQIRQDFARETRLEENLPKVGFIHGASITDDPETIAKQFREMTLGVSMETQRGWKTSLDAFNGWRSAVEDIGPLVFQTSDAKLTEMWGYSFPDELAPVITLNAQASYTGRTFTLMHELGHLLLDADGLCDIFNIPNDNASAKVEVWCNAFAGAFLVPKEELRAMVGHLQPMSALRTNWTDDEIERMAKTFNVSREVIMRRLLTQGWTTQAFYDRKRDELLKEYAQLVKKKKDGKKGFMLPHKKSVRNNGRSFIHLALDAYHQESITSRELSDYLGVKVDQVDKVEGEL